ncbi:S-layer region-like protein [Calothrix sp. NIES-4071]|nr:S-layer region-like protein [Calothrix sp. NIES-4071]BAZ62973.1 S-layer region-like protein [Calothrix sp. NIES-4105]
MLLKRSKIIFLTTCTGIAIINICLNSSKLLAQTNNNQTDFNSQLGCLSGYPDGTFRGDRAMTRYEFAAALAACLNNIEKNLPNQTSGLAPKSDLENLVQQQQKLNQELQELNNRVKE